MPTRKASFTRSVSTNAALSSLHMYLTHLSVPFSDTVRCRPGMQHERKTSRAVVQRAASHTTHLQMAFSCCSCSGVRRVPSRSVPRVVLGHLLPGFSGGSPLHVSASASFRSSSAYGKPLHESLLLRVYIGMKQLHTVLTDCTAADPVVLGGARCKC